MSRCIATLAALCLVSGSGALAQSEADKKRLAFEMKLSAEQKQMLNEYAQLRLRQGAAYLDPDTLELRRSLKEIRDRVVDQAAALSPDKAKVFWRDLPFTLKNGFRRLDPGHVTAAERKTAAGLPVTAKKEVARLLSDEPDEALYGRRAVLALGPACRALVADQLATLPAESLKRLRHQEILARFNTEEAHERRMRATEAAMHQLAKLEKERGKSNAKFAVLVARRICDLGARNDPYSQLNHYNFLRGNHDYVEGVRLHSLGAVKYSDVKKALGPETTAKWWKKESPPLTAVLGHVYLLHLFDPADSVDFCVKFRIANMSSAEWIIIEWERIPQEK